MSLKLKILPQYAPDVNYSKDVLQMEHDDVFFEKLIELEQGEGIPVENSFKSYVGSDTAFLEHQYGNTYKSAYGDIIKELKAIQLKLLFKDFKPLNWHNRAVKAFILQLPDEVRVWLYWH